MSPVVIVLIYCDGLFAIIICFDGEQLEWEGEGGRLIPLHHELNWRSVDCR